MANFLHDNEDLQFYLREGIDWDTLASLTERGFGAQGDASGGFKDAAEAREVYREIAGMVGEFVAEEVAPYGAEIDRDGINFKGGEATFPPRLQEICRKMADLGLHGMMLPRELGGQNAPILLYFINGEMLARADVSLMTHYGFHGGMAMAMLLLSVIEGTTEFDEATGAIAKTRFAAEIEEIVTGRAWGSMDITEPDAGSDMAALRTVATQGADGEWTLTGQKIFITSGHGRHHFVIARTGSPEDGLNGLSMFLVPAFEDGPSGRKRFATLDRIEEKLGHHGSATVAITFENTKGHLIGKPGDGFRYMLAIMNHARLAVGFESLGLMEAALRAAVNYAAERKSMGKTIDRHEMIADYIDEMETDILGIRALAMHAGYQEELSHKKSLFGKYSEAGKKDPETLEREIRQHKAAARRATPLLKYIAAEKAVEIARRSLQLHGGNGYMREFGAEKLLRDSLVLPIYEGTSQIQSLMAMKDTLGAIIKSPQAFAAKVARTRWQSLSARDGLVRRVAHVQQLSLAAQQHLVWKTLAAKVKATEGTPLSKRSHAILKEWNPKRDFTFAMLHAERLTRILVDEQIVEVLLAQAQKHPERREILIRYLDRAEPRVKFLHDEITSTGTRVLAALAERGRSAKAAEVAAPVVQAEAAE
ncbi:MAG TPA: acyl-CoA dehydrogenase family protein [Polyangia bacterium]